MQFSRSLGFLLWVTTAVQSTNILLSNDDGWAVAQIRAQNNALKAAGFNVILSAPAENKSGTGSSTATPTALTQECEFDSCPVGSPAEGFNASDTKLNYVNAFPVDSVRYGLQTLSPQFFGGPPELVVAGPNVGANLGTTVQISGTVGASCEAAKEGIPSIAFSGMSTSQSSYTTLDSAPTSTDTLASLTYAQLATTFVESLLASSARPILPMNTTLNVNFPSTSGCSSASDFTFVFTRNLLNSSAVDVTTCGSDHLPDENTVAHSSGCHISVSVLDANTKTDVDASTQALVLARISNLVTCF